MSNTFKTYYQLTKPGIVYGNSITATGGFLLASYGHVDLTLFLAMLVGISLVMASACVFNNYIDRDIDELMSRTKNRALVKGTISNQSAIIYATLLGIGGFSLLALYTNLLTTLIALVGFVFYVVLYGIVKRRSVHGTVVGSISGSVPPLVGYCAVSNNFDLGALILFLILVFWQMPHFYAIAIYRLKDYARAKIPVLPIKNGIQTTKVYITVYIFAFILATSALTLFGLTGYIYLVTMMILGMMWLNLSIQGFQTNDNEKWARKLFRFSLIVLMTFSIMISIDAWLI